MDDVIRTLWARFARPVAIDRRSSGCSVAMLRALHNVIFALLVSNFLSGAEFCASDGSDEPDITDPAFMCTPENFSDLKPPVKQYNSSDQYKIHYCNIMFLLDLDQQMTSEQNYSQVLMFISDTMATCMDRGVGYKVFAYPMFNDTANPDAKTICCEENDCMERFGFMRYEDYVGNYDSTAPLQQETARANFSFTLINDLKTIGHKPASCLYNSVVLITNRLFNVTNSIIFTELESIYTNGCITLTVIAVGNPAIDSEMLYKVYGNITLLTFPVPGFNCLDNLKDCIKPCGVNAGSDCYNRELTDCPFPTTTTTPSTTTSTTTPLPTADPALANYWQVIYLFAISNRTTPAEFNNLIKFVSDPLVQCQNEQIAVRLLARNNSDSGWITDMTAVGPYMRSLAYDEILLDAANTVDISDNVTLELVLKALSIPLSYNVSDPNHNKNEPRITLLTDFVSQNLVNAYNATLWRLEPYDFQIIAFNQATADIYLKNLPGKARNIHADPGYRDSNEIPMCHKVNSSSVTTIMLIIIGTCTGAMALLIIATILYRQKYMWMEKLNRFKNNHELEENLDDVIDHWELSWEKLIVKNERLGHGAYGQVFKGKIRGVPPAIEKYSRSEISQFTDCDCAVKMLPKYASDNAKEEFRHEIELMKTLGYNEHIVNMLGCITASPKSCLVLEYCSNRDLLRYVKQKKIELEISKSIDDTIDGHKEFLNFAWQIAQGMRFLGEKGIIHRDLAARNVLITGLLGMKSAKISDFGLAMSRDPVSSGNVSCSGRLPIKWLALESLVQEEFSVKSDVWSFGIVIFEMYSLGEVPFSDIEPTELILHLQNGLRPKRPLLATDKVAEVMNRCWLEDSSSRPSFEELSTIFANQLELTAEGYGYLALIKTNDYRVVAELHVETPPQIQQQKSNLTNSTGTDGLEDHVRICIDDNPPYASRKRAVTMKSNASVREYEPDPANSASSSDMSIQAGDDHSSYASRRSSRRSSKKEVRRRRTQAGGILPALNAFNPFSKDGHLQTLKKKFSTRRGSVPY
ncbi:unnamed protein product [Caenorhabditis auriculariae]|uniref:Protein kinase domain-containing protein n=1 Tax=Caenorhabditis auriculariae TaxID=2777116 RepID=A0A8S1H938_9PELO|nr:unnamed protein product [Caenorhabditis auriculariae]